MKKINVVLKTLVTVYIAVMLVGIGSIHSGVVDQFIVKAKTKTYIQTWSLYSNTAKKVVYCNDHSTYWPRFKEQAKVWNKQRNVLKQWAKGDLVTCRVQDFAEISQMDGRTYKTGFIVFNPNNMRKLQEAAKNHVVLHEQGHALGLDHCSKVGQEVMAANTNSICTLKAVDKASFEAAYKKFVLGR